MDIDLTPDERGYGRLKYEGKYFGLPIALLKELAQANAKLARSEAKIKAYEEQEPSGYRGMANIYDDDWSYSTEQVVDWEPLFTNKIEADHE